MALADPQSITIGTTPGAVSLPRTSTGVNSSVYTSADSTTKESISHQYGKRNRHLVRVDFSKVAPDPFQTDVNQRFSMSAYVVIDAPADGFSVAEQKDVVTGLLSQLTASSGALITKVIGGEN